MSNLLEAMSNRTIAQTCEAVAGEVFIRKVTDGFFFTARQDKIAEVLVGLFGALDWPILQSDAEHRGVQHGDAGLTDEPNGLGQRDSAVPACSAGAFQAARIRPSLQRGFADAGGSGQIFRGKQLLHGQSIHRPKTPVSEPIVLF